MLTGWGGAVGWHFELPEGSGRAVCYPWVMAQAHTSVQRGGRRAEWVFVPRCL